MNQFNPDDPKYNSLEYAEEMREVALTLIRENGGRIHLRDLLREMEEWGYTGYDLAIMITNLPIECNHLIMKLKQEEATHNDA